MNSQTAHEQVQRADFWFDPVCPWAWMASRWMLNVEKVRPVQVHWHQMSLAYLNQGRDLPPTYASMMEKAWLPSRVFMAAQLQASQTAGGGQAGEQAGQQLLAHLYTEFGQRYHVQGQKDAEQVLREALLAVGADPQLLDVGATTEVDPALFASHHEGMDPVGDEVGTPVIHVGGVAFFGPVISPAPSGEAAGQLWDGVVLVAATDGFFELKRSRTREPIFT